MNTKTEKTENQPLNSLNVNGITVTDSTKLKYVESNPKRKNSKARDRFEKYMKAKTVQEFYALGGTKGDLRYDEQHEFVKIITK